MKIGIVFDDSLNDGGGVQQYINTLGDYLIGEGHDVKFLVAETDDKEKYGDRIIELCKNIPVSINKNKVTTPIQPYLKKIIKTIAEEKFDILHVQMPYTPVMAQIIIALSDIPKIATFHAYAESFLINFSTTLLSIIQRDQVKNFYKIIALSDASHDFVKTNFNLDSVIIPAILNLKENIGKDKIAKFDDGKLNILFLGRLVERKGVMHLLKAYDQITDVMSSMNFRLIIAGKGPLREQLEEYAKSKKLPNVVFTGFIPESEKSNYLHTADICVFPAISGESFGIVLIEAMSNGKPILAGDNDGYRTVMRGSGSFLLVDPKDTELFAQKLKALIEDKSLRNYFGEWSNAESKKYDVDEVGKKILDLYTEAVKSYKKRGDIEIISAPLRFIVGIFINILYAIFFLPIAIFKFFSNKNRRK